MTGASPVVHYTFNGQVGTSPSGTNLPDSSGNGTDLYVRDSGAVFVPGNFGQTAVNANGAFMYSPASQTAPALQNLTAWTNSIWINIPSANAGNNQGIMSTRWPDNNGFELSYQPGTGIYLAVSDGSSWVGYGYIPETIPSDSWQMITTTVSSAGLNLYVNGVLIGTEADLTQGSAWNYGGTPLFMNSDSYLSFGYGQSVAGNLSAPVQEFNLFDTVLTQAQVLQLYDGQAGTVGALPVTDVQMAAGVLDLNGVTTTVASLSDINGGGGIVTNSGAAAATLVLTPSTGEVNSFSGTIQDGASQTALTINGAGGLQILNGTNTYSGLTTITAGTLQLGDGSNVGSINNSSGVVVNDTLTFNNPGSSIFAPPISGSGNVIQMTGTVILTGASTFDGTTTIDPYATLQIGNGGSAGSFTGAGTIVNNGQLVFDLTSDTTLPANISGGGALIQNGTGMVVLTGNNTYNGGTLIQSGVVQFNGDNTVPTGVPGSVLINSPGAVAVADNGTLYNTVTGWLTSGLIAPTSNGAIALIGDSSESIDMTNYPLLSLGAVGTVNFTGQITPGSTNYNLGGGGGTLTYSSQLTDDGTFGSMGVNISGPGTVVFANNTNNYSGATLVSSGVLQGNGNVPATSTVQIAAAGVYDLAGVSQTIAGLADGPSDSGVVTNSGGGIGAAATLTLAPATGISNTFTGVIQDGNPGGQNVLDHGRPRHAGPRRLQYLYRHDDRQRRRAQYRRRGRVRRRLHRQQRRRPDGQRRGRD